MNQSRPGITSIWQPPAGGCQMLVMPGRLWFISVPPPRPRPPPPAGAPLRRPGLRCLAYCRDTGRSRGGGRRQQLFPEDFWPPAQRGRGHLARV